MSGTATLVVEQQAAQLAIWTQPVAAEFGVPFTTQPVVEVQDANGNVVTSDNETVVTVSVDDAGGDPATLETPGHDATCPIGVLRLEPYE